MSPRRGVLVLAAGALLLSSNLTYATPITEIEPVAQALFSPVPEGSPRGSVRPASTQVIVDVFRPESQRPRLRPMSGPPPQLPPAQALAEVSGPIAPPSGSLSGHATWYCGAGSRCTRGHPNGLYAAIRRDLLYLRGQQVTVSSNGRSVVVTIIDCNCGANANLIDLYTDAFTKLAPLSRGRIVAEVSW